MLGFVDLTEFIPGLHVELRYATARNFLGRPVYPSPRAWLREPVAARLAVVETSLRRQGWGLKVWDAFRPAAVQREMWRILPDPRFVAPPERGSRHTRGAAVDVTIIDLRTGLEGDMGTDFDDFSPLAASECPDLPAELQARRQWLRREMQAAGFSGIRSEWWHFDAVDWEQFPLVES